MCPQGDVSFVGRYPAVLVVRLPARLPVGGRGDFAECLFEPPRDRDQNPPGPSLPVDSNAADLGRMVVRDGGAGLCLDLAAGMGWG